MNQVIVFLSLASILLTSPFTFNSNYVDEAFAQGSPPDNAGSQGKEKTQQASQKSQQSSQDSQSSPPDKSTQVEDQSDTDSQANEQKSQDPNQTEQKESASSPTQSQSPQSETQEPEQSKSQGRYIVVLDEGVHPREFAKSHGLIPAFVYSKALNGLAGNIPEDVIEKLRQDPRVKFVEPDQESFAFAQSIPTGVDRIDADLSIAKIDGIDERIDADVAILDTGVYSHSDLNVFSKVDCTNDGNPCSNGGDDRLDHGTHVAGIVAALDDGDGVVGVAPGAKIWSVKVLGDDGVGWISWVIAGIDYVTLNSDNIEVANLSLGCECQSDALDDAISRSIASGVVYSVAAGNSAKDVSSFSPASHPDVLTVSALSDLDGQPGNLSTSTCAGESDDSFASFSNHGTGVDLISPGVCILSTLNDGGYGIGSGTSMSAPNVAGTVALYLSENPKPQSADDVRSVNQKIIDMGVAADSDMGYDTSNDPDGIAELLVYAGAMPLPEETVEEPIEESTPEQEEPVDESEDPIEESNPTPPEEDDSSNGKKKGHEIAEEMRKRGLAIAEQMRQNKDIGDSNVDSNQVSIEQRGLDVAEKIKQKGIVLSDLSDDESQDEDSTGGSFRGLDIAQSLAVPGLNIGKTMLEKETVAETKSEVAIEKMQQRIEKLESRIQSLLDRVKQGDYHVPSDVTEDEQKTAYNLSFEGQLEDDESVFGSLYLENTVTRNNVAKFKVTGGEIIADDFNSFDVVLGNARVVEKPAEDVLTIIVQLVDVQGEINTAKLVMQSDTLKDDLNEGIGEFEVILGRLPGMNIVSGSAQSSIIQN